MSTRTSRALRKWRRLVSEQARSGKTAAEFCQERGLCRPYFFVWKKRLRRDLTAKFLEVRVAEPAPRPRDDTCIEVRLQNGRSLVVGRRFDPEQLRELIAVVEGAG